MPTLAELKKEFITLALQIEHFEAQLKNTFKPEEKEEARRTLKFLKDKIDVVLDQYNINKKFGQET